MSGPEDPARRMTAVPQEGFNATQLRPVLAKIVSMDELGQIAESARAAGKRIVLCHGTFDLLHVGHIRHLQRARMEGDVLVVTVTADEFVRRGPGRPVFPAPLRAEMLAATQIVDWVAINDAPTAEIPIQTVRPYAYVKGADYKDPSEDVTGNIVNERMAVEKAGGKLVFTEDITFSSSALLNRHGNIYDPEVQAYLQLARSRNTAARITDLLDRAAGLRVTVIGDAIIDEYHYVEPMGKSPKENLIPTRFRETEQFAGGAFAAANHVAGFCREVELITVVGSSEADQDLIRRAMKPNVSLKAVRRESSITTRKSRFVDVGYGRKLFEVCYMDDAPISGAVEARMVELVAEAVERSDLVVVADFGHGIITSSVKETFQDKAKFLAVNAQTNSANVGFNLITKYRRADYICIDAPEAHLAVANRDAGLEEVASRLLPGRIACDRVILTHGRHGCVAWQQGREPIRVPAFTKSVVDTMGAGDAFLSVTAPLMAVGGDIEDVAFVGNAAGALKVNILGHRASVEKIDLLKFCQTILK